MFEHYPQVLPSIRRDDTGTRKYITPQNKHYPSITTLLGSLKDQTGLAVWRNREGATIAECISKLQMEYGTRMHEMIEHYLKNEDISYEKSEGVVRYFHGLMPLLQNITNIRTQEHPLYSDELRVAGTVDCVAEYEGELSVIDFKVSRKIKKPQWIEDYFIQATAYSIMWKELTGEEINQIVILMSVQDDGSGIQYVRKPSDFIDKLKSKLREYYEQHPQC